MMEWSKPPYQICRKRFLDIGVDQSVVPPPRYLGVGSVTLEAEFRQLRTEVTLICFVHLRHELLDFGVCTWVGDDRVSIMDLCDSPKEVLFVEVRRTWNWKASATAPE